MRIKELAASAKEHLAIEEIQLAIGEFSIAATGYSIVAAEFVTGRIDFKSWMINGVMAQAAGNTGLMHWGKARDKIATKRGQAYEE